MVVYLDTAVRKDSGIILFIQGWLVFPDQFLFYLFMIPSLTDIKMKTFPFLPFHQNLMIHLTVRGLSTDETIPGTYSPISCR